MKTTLTLPTGLSHRLYAVTKWSDSYGDEVEGRARVHSLEEAQTVSSEVDVSVCDHTDCTQHRELRHAPVLDIDVPATLIPSSTPGHSHLYIDVTVPWRRYRKLLRVMADCGILEKSYVDVSIRRGGTHVRVPWVKKEKDSGRFHY